MLATEILTTLAWLSDPEKHPYPSSMLEKCWKKVLLNQFHDVLPGSCIIEIMDDLVEIWAQVDMDLLQLRKNALIGSSCASGDVLLFNPCHWRREATVFIPVEAAPGERAVLDASGKPPAATLVLDGGAKAPCQPAPAEPESLLDDKPAGWWCRVTIDGFATVAGKLEKGIDETLDNVEINVAPATISNGLASIELDPITGGITAFKVNGLNNNTNLLSGEMNNLTTGFEDDDVVYPAWNLKKEWWKYPKDYDLDAGVAIAIKNEGPVFSTLEITRTLGKSKVVQEVTLFAGDPCLYLSWHADWQERDTCLKLGFTTTTGAISSISDQMYCALSRPMVPLSKPDAARHEKIMQGYVDVSTPMNEWGLALLNEGKHAYDTVEPGCVRLTMHRCAEYPGPAAESWVRKEREARKNSGKPDIETHAGLGPVSCRYALFPHAGGALVNENNQAAPVTKIAAEEFNKPIIVVAGTGNNSQGQGIETTPGLLAFALKKEEWNQENAVVLRVAEVAGTGNKEAMVTLPEVLAKKAKAVSRADLLERPDDSRYSWDASTATLTFPAGPFEVVTFIIYVDA